MSFDVAADAYGRFMGRFSERLAAPFADRCGVRPGMQVLDVGCGPGALTAELVARLGAAHVTAVEPSPPFVAAVRDRLPGVDVRTASAEDLPFGTGVVDAALAQLVVHFMADPVRGLREMARVTRPGGVVGACVWDHAGDGGPLGTFWRAVHDVTPGAPDESRLAGAREGHLAALLAEAGLIDVESSSLTVAAPFASFDAWWETFTLGVGPAGAHVAGLDAEGRAELRARCAELLPAGAFEVTATAWCARGRVRTLDA